MVSLGHCALAHSTTCIVFFTYTQCACSLSLCIYTCMYMCISFMRLTATLGWEVMTSEERLVVSKVDTSRSAPDVQYSLLILSNFTWKIHVYGQEVPPSICRLLTFPRPCLRLPQLAQSYGAWTGVMFQQPFRTANDFRFKVLLYVHTCTVYKHKCTNKMYMTQLC